MRLLEEVRLQVQRTQIVRALTPGPLPVGDLAAILGRSKSATSQHLRVLREAGIVTARRLIGWWRLAIVGAFIIAAVVTPTPDPVTCTIVALPLIGLYFLGVLLAIIVQPRGQSTAQ